MSSFDHNYDDFVTLFMHLEPTGVKVIMYMTNNNRMQGIFSH